MKTLSVDGKSATSTILIGESISNLKSYLPKGQTVIITDTNVKSLYGQEFADIPTITIGTGENIKTLDTVKTIYQQLLDHGADRSTFIVGVGGGIVCDIAGFAASTYLRGLKFAFVSTTLLSQVDASVGGKNGVNFLGYKNMVGVFRQPDFVICDVNMLKTLPEKQIVSGFAEIVKHAAIRDESYFRYLEAHYSDGMKLDTAVIEKIVYDSVVIKADIVKKDEQEHGERRKLNFGHTFGHAIEKVSGMLHGQAVSMGMVLACRLSVHRKRLDQADARRIELLLESMGLPVTFEGKIDPVMEALTKDKKREQDGIYFVLLDGIGKAVVEKIPIADIQCVMKT